MFKPYAANLARFASRGGNWQGRSGPLGSGKPHRFSESTFCFNIDILKVNKGIRKGDIKEYYKDIGMPSSV